jgi:hypothetical protein
MFYGSHMFYFTLFDKDIDGESILDWLQLIADNTKLIQKLVLLHRKKDSARYNSEELKEQMIKLGVHEDAIVFKRLSYPFCSCEGCQLWELQHEHVDAALSEYADAEADEAGDGE